MAIMPVSGVSVNKKNNIINFEGKKNKEVTAPQRSYTSSVKAIPLAVLIAMSPVNASSANTISSQPNVETIENTVGVTNNQDNIKLVFEESPAERSRFQFYSKTNNKNSIDEVVLRLTGHPFDVEKLVNTTLELVGDDGISAGEVKFKQLILAPSTGEPVTMGDANETRCEYIQKFIDGKLPSVKNNNAIPVENQKRVIRLGLGCELQNVKPNTSWLVDGANRKEAFGLEIGHLDVKTNTGDYRVTVYDMDDSKNDFEVVTIKREDGPEFKVAALRGAQVKLEDFGGDIANLNFGVIELNKRHSKNTARIINNELFEALAGLLRDTGYNNAFETSITSSLVSVLNGVVYTKN